VAELCYSVDAGSNFNTSDIYASHGNGAINADGTSDIAASVWSNTAASFIAKGGDFTSFQNAELMISDRTRANVSDVRDSTMGFRAVHTFGGGGNFTINAGAITGPEYTCPNIEIELSNVTEASCMDMQIFYSWYVKLPGATTFKLIEGEAKDVLTYLNNTSRTSSMQTLTFRRTATCAVGEASTEFSVKLDPYPFSPNGQSTFNAGSAVSIVTNDVVERFSFYLQGSPSSFYLTPTNKQVNVNVGDYCALTFYLIGHINRCTDSVVRAISINGEIPYSGTYKSVILAAGTYRMECWGGAGSQRYSNSKVTTMGGLGGYARGDIELKNDLRLYVYVGGAGTIGNKKGTGGTGGWNGGGNGGGDDSDDTGPAGGGGTDIRLVSGNLYSRIIVAGGGGTGGKVDEYWGNGGGGLSGQTYNSTSTAIGKGGTQTTGYAFGSGGPGSKGGSGYSGGGGGGGGYWGGTGSKRNSSQGGGGSGFVSGMSGCNAVVSSASSSPSGSPNHYSGYVFTNASMTTGTRSGNGLARITRLK
jgi:hypothetical protein